MNRRSPDDALTLLRECQDRDLEREGIPMVLVLADEVGDDDQADQADQAELDDGVRLASWMDDLRQALAPTARDGDMGRVIMVLQATSYLDFGQGRTVL